MSEERRVIRCAIYTRKSTEEGLEQEFNSLDAQFEACGAYIVSQKSEGWKQVSTRYDDGGFSGGTLDRPGVTRLLADIEAGRIDMVVVYKIDRLTRSLMDFSKIVERLDKANCSFASVTQSFNTATSMGRLVLNVLLSFAQFEREVTAERIRDKFAASKKKGIWMGGTPSLGYFAKDRQLHIDETEAPIVRQIFDLYRTHRCVVKTRNAAIAAGLRARAPTGSDVGPIFSRGGIHWLLTNPVYIGEIRHHKNSYPGLHAPIIDRAIWDEVQTQLTALKSGPTRGRRNVAWRSLLTGKLLDETGDSLGPTYGGSGAGRRHYYVSRRLIEGAKRSDTGGWRLPGEHLERTVAALVVERLKRSGTVIEAMPTITDAGAASGVDLKLRELSKAEDLRETLSLVKQVRIAPLIMEIDLDQTALASALGVKPKGVSEQFLKLSAPFQTRRRGQELRLIFGDEPPEVDQALLRYVAKGWVWWEAIQKGSSLAQLAKAENVSPRLIANHLPVAFLSPDIIELIVTGRHPPGLSVTRLRRTILPMLWDEQRAALGISHAAKA